MDGAVVLYENGARVNCGPVSKSGRPHVFGGHASEMENIPKDVDIAQVELHASRVGAGCLEGIRVTLTDGQQWGELNMRPLDGADAIISLKPGRGDRIVGLFGKSEKHNGFPVEFGILTAKEGEKLPDICYEMKELQNIDD